LRSILIGLDGSTCGSAAIELGIRWAQRFDALLVGIGIVDEPTILKPEPVPIGASHHKLDRDRHRLECARRRVEECLECFARRCDAADVRYRVLDDTGEPEAQLAQKSRLCDLVLLGQRTSFRFATQDWPDTTVQNVLRQSSRPVVAVPEMPPEGASVVVAYNGSPQADWALQAFESLGLAGADVVHVLSIHADCAVAERLAEQTVAFLQLHGITAVPHAIRPLLSIDKLMLAQVRELQARLLVMGARCRSPWREAMFGSTTTSVLQASPVPLLLCR